MTQEDQTQCETEDAGTPGEEERRAAKTFVSFAARSIQHVDPALPGPGSPETTEMEVESEESSYSWRSTAKAENGKEKSRFRRR